MPSTRVTLLIALLLSTVLVVYAEEDDTFGIGTIIRASAAVAYDPEAIRDCVAGKTLFDVLFGCSMTNFIFF